MNTVAPGPLLTDAAGKAKFTDEAIAGIMSMTRAADRLSTAEDIADIVSLLVTERSRWITGQYISASGGITGQ